MRKTRLSFELAPPHSKRQLFLEWQKICWSYKYLNLFHSCWNVASHVHKSTREKRTYNFRTIPQKKTTFSQKKINIQKQVPKHPYYYYWITRKRREYEILPTAVLRDHLLSRKDPLMGQKWFLGEKTWLRDKNEAFAGERRSGGGRPPTLHPGGNGVGALKCFIAAATHYFIGNYSA